MFEWYVVRTGTKWISVYQRFWADLDYHLMKMRFFTLIMNKIIILFPKILREVAMALIWIC